LDLVRPPLAAAAPVAHHDRAARPAAVAMILHQSADDLEALFIKRAARAGDPWSGQIAFPGGRFEPTDADLLATAVRETREETGIDLRAAEQLGVLDDLNPRTPTLPPIVVRPFVFGVAARPTLSLSPDEVQRAFWLPFT
jgi:8-oxo-dGTP pyrophosphatase MutT (NUDIX family)